MATKKVNSLNDYCDSIAETISDFRRGEISPPDRTHVKRWICQFPDERRVTIAKEMDHLLDQTYLSKSAVKIYLRSLIDNTELLNGETPKKFWKRVNFLRLQNKGSSQADLLSVFGGLLRSRVGYGTHECGSASGPYFYLDDFIFTGQTVRRELLAWLKLARPSKPKLHTVFLAFHTYGQHYAEKAISEVVEDLKGETHYWHAVAIEDRKTMAAACDTFRPRMIYSDTTVQSYVKSFTYDVALRRETTSSEFYRTEKGRRVLEHEFLRSGLKIRGFCGDPEEAMRPLGFSALESFGTGTIVATYRNCPNTAPLAWWWGDPTAAKGHTLSKWYPLFPRKYRIH